MNGLDDALKERADILHQKLKNCEVVVPEEIVIHYKRKGRNKYRTWGEFTIVGTDYKGYILERPKGDNPAQLEDFKRHPAGTYDLIYSEDSEGDEKFNYVTLCLKENTGYKLHCGNRADNSDGCFLINDNSPKNDKYPEAFEAILKDINKKQTEGFKRTKNENRTPSNQYPAKYPKKADGTYEIGASAHKNPENAAYKLRKRVEQLEQEIMQRSKQQTVIKKIIIDESSEIIDP